MYFMPGASNNDWNEWVDTFMRVGNPLSVQRPISFYIPLCGVPTYAVYLSMSLLRRILRFYIDQTIHAKKKIPCKNRQLKIGKKNNKTRQYT